MILCECGKPTRRGGTECAACAMRRYRATTAGRLATRAANKRWMRSEKGKAYRRRHYAASKGIPDDLKAVQEAVKRLEKAVAAAA